MIGLLAVLEIPLVHWSVRLWRSLHQEATVLDPEGDVEMDGLMLFSLFVGVVAFTLLYVWLVMHRTRAMAMEDLLDDHGLDVALATGAPKRAADGDAGGELSMEDAGFIIGSYVVTFGDGRVRRLAVRPSRPPAGRAGARRRQVLAVADDRPRARAPVVRRRVRTRPARSDGGSRSSCSGWCSSPAA